MKRLLITLLLLSIALPASSATADQDTNAPAPAQPTNQPPPMATTPPQLAPAPQPASAQTVVAAATAPGPQLTLQDCINIALKQNTAVLKSQQEIRRAHGVLVQARGAMVPQISASGQHERIDHNAVDRFPFGGTGGTRPLEFNNQQQPWVAQVEFSQAIYAGGQLLAGYDAAKLSKQIAVLGFERTVADTVLQVRDAFYRILSAAALVVVREQSVKLLERQLQDAQHRFDVGAVPRFNVLRAEVELANARPPLIRAQNDLRLAREALVTLLALETPAQKRQDFTPIQFIGELRYKERSWNLADALAMADERRPELKQAEKQVRVAKDSLRIAHAGYRPQVSVFADYGIRNTAFRDEIDRSINGWTVGARATWDLFDGLQTQGRIAQSRAQLEQAELDYADSRRNIEFEVRQAFSDYLQAVALVNAQRKTVEQAEESLRLAEARFNAGAGTQLDVLSAQTALTDARSNEIQALYEYNSALAKLDRATGSDVKTID